MRKERKNFMDENMISTEQPMQEVRTISFGDYEGLVVEHAYPYRYEGELRK